MSDREISIEKLEKAYVTAARIVALYGDIYLAGFQRLHDELEKRRKQQDIKAIALKVANR